MDIQTEIQSCLDCLIDLQKCANERNDLQDICAKQGPGNGGVPLFFNVIKPIVLPMGPMTEDGLYQHISPIKMVIHHHISSIYHPYLYHHISPWLGESLDPPWHQWQYSPVTGLTMNMTNSSKTFMEYPRVLTLLIHTNPFSLICIYIYIDIQLYTYNIYIYYIYILSTRQTSWWM